MDFGFRQYDPQIGRFLGVDPLADYYGQEHYSPYAAMGNQPESMIDLNGLKYESTYQGVHHNSTYFVDDGGYYNKSYGEKTMMDMRIEGIEGYIFNFISSLGGASFSSEMQTQINNSAFWNYMMNIYLKSEGNFLLKAENNMLKLSFQTSWSENSVVFIQLNTFYIDLSSFGKSGYNNNQQSSRGTDWMDVNTFLNRMSIVGVSLSDIYVDKHSLNRLPKWLTGSYNRSITMGKNYTNFMSIQMRRLGWKHGGRAIQNVGVPVMIGTTVIENTVYYNEIINTNPSLDEVKDHYDTPWNPIFWMWMRIENQLKKLGPDKK